MAIAVLGGGILGVCTALELADRGYRVVLFERNSELVSEASLHNEGKLHLGFVYAADPSFRTAQRMIDGASRFMATLRRWVPEAGIQALPARPFDYVVHRETMTTVCQIEAHFARVAGSVEKLRREQPLAGACDRRGRPGGGWTTTNWPHGILQRSSSRLTKRARWLSTHGFSRNIFARRPERSPESSSS
jgi:glycerol-3-phosphate dehydrogenase